MERRLALGLLGLEQTATPEDVERAYWEKCAELEDRIRIAPTPALKKVYREALETLEEARAAALGLEEMAAAEEIPADTEPVAEEAAPAAEEPVFGEEPEPPGEPVAPTEVVLPEESAAPAEETVPAAAAPVPQEPAAAPGRVVPPPYEPLAGRAARAPAAPEEEEPDAIEELAVPEAPAPPEGVRPSRVEESAALSAAETAVGFLEGQILVDRYDVRFRIALGRTGALYGAYDLKLQRQIAIKVLLPECLKYKAVRQRFAAEVKVASYLSHPNIAQVYELLQDGTTDFLTLELLKGRTLREEMDSRRRSRQPFKIRDVSRVGRALCEALQYAHTYTTHRSVRPDNVFLCADGTVKLTDFAMVALASPAARGEGPGIAEYLAPEQRRGGATVDHRADQYAVGAVLYEMLTGGVPQTPIQPVASLRRDTPAEMAKAIDRALQSDPAGRFSDMRTFGQSLPAPSIELKIPPLAWAAGALAVVLGVGVVTYLAWRPAGPEPPTPTSEEEREDKRAVTQAMVVEAARLATARARAEEERLAAERAKAEAERAATMAQAEAERVATMRAQAEAERVAAAEREREEAARMTATRAAEALSRAEEEARVVEENRVATRKQAEANRTATAVAREEERREKTARVQAEADERATARAEADQARVATVEAREQERREATERAQGERAERTARAAVQETARAVATARQGELDARKDFVPDLNATVTALRFFEKARGEQIPEGKRQYADRFKSSDARAVYWELSLAHPPLGQRKNITIRSVCYRPDGSVFGEGELKTYVEANWGKSKHIYGWGFDEPGQWKDGKYRVDLFIGNKKIKSGSFQIYSGFF